jgi:hypothetical protein
MEHLREYHNDSPYPEVILLETDNETYAKYTIELSGSAPTILSPDEPIAPSKEPEKPTERLPETSEERIKLAEIASQERLKEKELKMASLERALEKGLITKQDYIDAIIKL